MRIIFVSFFLVLTFFCSPAISETSVEKVFTSPALGAKFVLIPAGTFMMGSPASEQERSNEETQHQVTISKPFYMQTTVVTREHWKRVMGNYPSTVSKCGDACPAANVSWNDVQEFISKLNKMERTAKYRLPTEAEWEHAARAGTTTPFYTGNCLSTDQANFDGNYIFPGCAKGEFRQKILRAGSFSPNAWGLYDMAGNVWQWVQDWYGDYPLNNITDPVGPSYGRFRVLRGGDWFSPARFCRSAYRGLSSPLYGWHYIGFRLARTP